MIKRFKRLSGYLLSILILIMLLYFNFLKPRWKYIIIHHSATELGSVRIFRNGHKARGGAWPFNDPMLYHLVIGNGNRAGDGELQAGLRWSNQQFGGGCSSIKGVSRIKSFPDALRAWSDYFNFTGIHICLVGDFEKTAPRAVQMAILKDTVTVLCRRYHVPPDSILAHKDAQLAPTNCPGKNFSMDKFRSEIATNLKSGVKVKVPSLVTWKIRLINFWPVWGILLGEVYYSSFLILLNAGLFFILARIALPLAWKSRIGEKETVPVDIRQKGGYQDISIVNPEEGMKR